MALGEPVDRLAALPLAERRRLEARLALRRAGRRPDSIAASASSADALPSLLQQRLLFACVTAGSTALYNIAGAVVLTGDLQLAWLAAALSQVVRRHEALRTVFPDEGGNTIQRVTAARGCALPVIDCRPLPAGRRELQVRLLLAAEAGAPFDLARGPLCRFTLLRDGGARHVLCCVLHHLVADWRSLQLLVRELAALYGALARGAPPALPALPIQYRDFAAWQRRWLRGDVLAEQAAYWRRQLSGAPCFVDLPSDYPRPPHPSPRGAEHVFEIPRRDSEPLLRLAGQAGCTPFAALLAVYLVFLRHHSGQQDLVVSAPISCRDRLECETLIGFFVNTLVLRVDLSGARTFGQLLRHVRQVVSGGLEHRHLPLDRVIGEVAPARSTTRAPLLEISFSYLDREPGEVELPGVTVESAEIGAVAAQFDLNLIVVGGGDGLRCALQYRRDLYADATIAAWALDLRELAGQLAVTADATLDDLDRALRRQSETRRAAARQELSEAVRARFAALSPGAGVRAAAGRSRR